MHGVLEEKENEIDRNEIIILSGKHFCLAFEIIRIIIFYFQLIDLFDQSKKIVQTESRTIRIRIRPFDSGLLKSMKKMIEDGLYTIVSHLHSTKSKRRISNVNRNIIVTMILASACPI